MLCSEREMGLSDEHDGIIELDPEAPVGAPFAQFMGLDDPLFDIGIMPNRADCLGVLRHRPRPRGGRPWPPQDRRNRAHRRHLPRAPST